MKKYIIFVLMATLTAITAAQSKRISIDFTKELIGLDNKPIFQIDKKPATLGDVCVNALESQLEEDKQMQGDEKFKLDQLARKIYMNHDAVLSAEEISVIKHRIGKAYGPLIVGISWRLLDPSI